MSKNYTITLSCLEATYDWDDLICINQQMFAIAQGWADPIKVFILDDTEPVTEWKWSAK